MKKAEPKFISIPNRHIDTTSPIPIYHQIANDLKLLATNDRWQIGTKIPSEKVLAEKYQVSRVTLRQALAELEHDDIIRKIKGFGSIFTSTPVPFSQTLSLPGVSEGKDANTPRSNFIPKVITLEQCSPIPTINKYLQLKEKQSLIYIKRIFMSDNRPIALNRSWIAPQNIPGILEKGMVEGSMTRTLLSYNLKAHSISNSIESINCSPIDMKLLEISYNTPVILVSSLSYLQDEEPLEFSKTIWIGDKIKFKVNINRNDSILTSEQSSG